MRPGHHSASAIAASVIAMLLAAPVWGGDGATGKRPSESSPARLGLYAPGIKLGASTRLSFGSGNLTFSPGQALSRLPLLLTPGSVPPYDGGMSLTLRHRINATLSGNLRFAGLRDRQDWLGDVNAWPAPILFLPSPISSPSLQGWRYGLTAELSLNGGGSLLFESSYAYPPLGFGTPGAEYGKGVSHGYGVGFLRRKVLGDSDALLLSARQPGGLIAPAAWQPGGETLGGQPWSGFLAPEKVLDYRLSYEALIGRDQAVNFVSGYRHDAANGSGNGGAYLGSSWRTRF